MSQNTTYKISTLIPDFDFPGGDKITINMITGDFTYNQYCTADDLNKIKDYLNKVKTGYNLLYDYGVASAVSQLENDAGYIVESEISSQYEYIQYKPLDMSSKATKNYVNQQSSLISAYFEDNIYTKANINTMTSFISGNWHKEPTHSVNPNTQLDPNIYLSSRRFRKLYFRHFNFINNKTRNTE